MADAEGPSCARAGTGRGISTAGLVGLAIAFFLPQVPGCDTPVVPSQDFRSFLWPLFFAFYFAFAMLVVYLVRLFLRSDRARRILSHAAAAVTLAALLIYDWFWWCSLSSSNLGGSPAALCEYALAVSAAAGTIAAVWLWAKASRNGLPALCVALVGFVSFLLFLFFAILGAVLWGLWVSLASSFLMTYGGLIEWSAPWKRLTESPLDLPAPPR